jgi:hypothetical protein
MMVVVVVVGVCWCDGICLFFCFFVCLFWWWWWCVGVVVCGSGVVFVCFCVYFFILFCLVFVGVVVGCGGVIL